MIVLSGALVLVALVLLVFGALDRNLPYVYASIGVSLLSLLLLFVGILQRRGELTGDEPGRGDDARRRTPPTSRCRRWSVPGPSRTRHGRTAAAAELGRRRRRPSSEPASRRVVPAPARRRAAPSDARDAEEDVHDDLDADERRGRGVDDLRRRAGRRRPRGGRRRGAGRRGRGLRASRCSSSPAGPRYHLEGCRVLRGKEPQPLDRDDARTHGFTPCGVCKPDADETAAAAAARRRRPAAVLHRGALRRAAVRRPAGDQGDRRAGTSELPDRPVQPVLPGARSRPARGTRRRRGATAAR